MRWQIRCGDLYSDEAVGAFNTCAVTKNKCVSQIPDDGEIKVPSPDKLVQSLNTADMDGRWYIASGLNKLFDIFDCQASASGLNGYIGWVTAHEVN
jgi:violaxanthin de-epoxidase